MVPFVKDGKRTEKDRLDYKSPYRQIMSDLQRKRRSHAKNSFHDLMYKLIGNSVYMLAIRQSMLAYER
jgi:DNA-binding GntR family transcriptional regulator